MLLIPMKYAWKLKRPQFLNRYTSTESLESEAFSCVFNAKQGDAFYGTCT